MRYPCLVILLGLLAGCSKSNGGIAKTCDGIAGDLGAQIGGSDGAAMTKAVLAACKDGAWTQQVIDCYATPTRSRKVKNCKDMLTPAQDEQLGKLTMDALIEAEQQRGGK